jgi:hypothetical protein
VLPVRIARDESRRLSRGLEGHADLPFRAPDSSTLNGLGSFDDHQGEVFGYSD